MSMRRAFARSVQNPHRSIIVRRFSEQDGRQVNWEPPKVSSRPPGSQWSLEELLAFDQRKLAHARRVLTPAPPPLFESWSAEESIESTRAEPSVESTRAEPSVESACSDTRQVQMPEELEDLDLSKLRIPGAAFAKYASSEGASTDNGSVRSRLDEAGRDEYVEYERAWTRCLSYMQLDIQGEDMAHASGHRTMHLLDIVSQEKLDIPVEGHLANALWKKFAKEGLKTKIRRQQLVWYAEALKRRTGMFWPRFYQSVMLHTWEFKSWTALRRHQTLKPYFPPNKAAYQALLKKALDVGGLNTLLRIYIDHPILGLYDHILPVLYDKKEFVSAVQFKEALIKAGDAPSDSLSMRQLLLDHAQRVDENQRDLYGATQAVPQPKAQSLARLEGSRNDTLVEDGILLHTFREIADSSDGFNDHQCAQLLATTKFSVEKITQGLRVFHVERLGPVAIRSLAARSHCRSDLVLEHLDYIESAGIVFDNSIYSTVLSKAAADGNDDMLRFLVDSEFEPGMFNDKILQERLLARSVRSNDPIQFQSTKNVLLAKTAPRHLFGTWTNILVRTHAALLNRDEIVQGLTTLRQQNLPLETITLIALRKALLRQRTNFQIQPYVPGDLMILLNTMKDCVAAGVKVPIYWWKEIMKRLGMFGHRREYQDLALWIADSYATPRTPGVRIASVSGAKPGITSAVSHAILLPASPNEEDPLSLLFDKSAIQAIVAWGFKSARQEIPNLDHATREKVSQKSSMQERLWGVRLLKQLQKRGVAIRKQDVARACMLRLKQLFNEDRESQRGSNRACASLNQIRVAAGMPEFESEWIIKEIGQIWGPDIFDIYSPVQASSDGQESMQCFLEEGQPNGLEHGPEENNEDSGEDNPHAQARGVFTPNGNESSLQLGAVVQ